MPNIISKLEDALAQNPRSIGRNGNLGVFGGEGGGFAQSVLDEATKNFYVGKAVADASGVAKGMNSPIPRSIFNEYALFNFRGLYGGLTGGEPFDFFKDQPENPLMGGYNAHNVSISRLIEFFDEHYPKIGYKAQDFLYCKYYKQIPVNHLVTLRRFPVPVTDNIFDLSLRYDTTPGAKDPTFEVADVTQIAGVTAVTYLGETAGNKLDDILKFSYGLNWKDIESKMEAVENTDQGYTNQPFYSKIGGAGRALVDTARGITPGAKFRGQQSPGGDRFGTTYANFTIGPVNVVNKTAVRDMGLKFENDMKLTFEYELKSLNYVNPKIAMIDLISNMLTMTTNNAQFFGGGHRYYGSAGYVASSFGNMSLLRQGNFSGYIGSVVGQVQTGFKNTFGDKNGNFNIESTATGLFKGGKTLLGNMLGGFLSGQMGAVPSTQATAAFISGEPTGNWHVTVGNPLNPIVMMGNMYCDNTMMTLGHGLGYDDFPMEVKFEVDVKHGKPRDKGDIENMFNAGRGRIYASAEKEDDILNLKGQDLATYGSVKPGKINLQKTQSAAQAGDVKPETKPFRKSKGTSIFTSDDASYVSNVVSMIIDS
jgi:hypothetical protein